MYGAPAKSINCAGPGLQGDERRKRECLVHHENSESVTCAALVLKANAGLAAGAPAVTVLFGDLLKKCSTYDKCTYESA